MPLVEHADLPTFSRLREQGHLVLSLEQALRQDIRELHIGFLNMMPDGALQATERQFIRLVGNSNRIAQFFVYPFSLPGIQRGKDAQEHVDRHYFRFEQLQRDGLDALIITGANVENRHLDREPFWEPLVRCVNWARQNVVSVLCSCLATHALLKHLHGIERQPLAQKRWGVYSHRTARNGHPLLHDVNTRFDAPHSRHNDISRVALEEAGLTVLSESIHGEVHMAISPDQARVLYFQGHPEYDINSLLKEYKREVLRFAAGELAAPPPFPENYFNPKAQRIAQRYVDMVGRRRASRARENTSRLAEEEFPARELESELDNTWGDTAKVIVNNWLGLVYQLTHPDRTKQFMSHINPDDPLQLRRRG
ncbi:MAG: homoserine O-succinyltransferase [Polyangiaceae bacterium]|jgi:homoserine O-succinyltransferase|nr:homoserine O-succinyltransferase [Polyangiaceae bacterium]